MTIPAADTLRSLVAKHEDFTGIAEKIQVTPGTLLDFQLGIKDLSPIQLEKLAKAVFFGAASIKDGKLYILRDGAMATVCFEPLLVSAAGTA